MTSSFATPLHFAVHLLAVFVALGVALSLFREPGRGSSWLAGILGFLSLGVGEAVHAGAFAGDLDGLPVTLRTAGYVLILGSVLVGRSRAEASAFLGLSGSAVAPGVAAAAAAAAMVRRGGAGRLSLGGGLALLAASELLMGGAATWADPVAHGLRAAGWLLAGGYVVAAARKSIQFRFVTGFVSVLVFVVLIISMAVTQVIDRNVRAGAFARLRGQATDVNDRLNSEGVDQAQVLVAIVAEVVREALEGGAGLDGEEVGGIVESLLPGVDFVTFLDAQGRELGTQGLTGGRFAEVVGTDVVQESCLRDGLVAASLDALGPRGMGLIGCAVLRDGQEVQAVGVAGYGMDADLLNLIRPPGGRIAVFRGANPIPVALTGAFPGVSGRKPMVPAALLQRVQDAFLFGEEGQEQELRVGTGRYFSAFAPLRRTDGRVIGVLMVAEPAAVAAQTRQEVTRIIFLVALGVILLAFFLALLAARRITRPVVSLTRAARRVQAGELAAKADVIAQDEVGDLARAFNQMTDSVNEATGKLRAAADAEARLRDRLETVLNSMGDGLLAADDDGRISTYNPAAASIVGLPPKEVIGRPVHEVLRGRDADGEELVLDEDLPPGLAFVSRFDGAEVPVAITSSLLRDASGVSLGRVFVLRDMTREHEVERMKTEFLSNVSHELRTPLTPIIGYSEIMTRRGVPSERGQEFAGAILDSARRLERIVAMLVDFSAMEGGRMTIEARPTSLRKLVKSAVDDWKGRAGQHRFVTKFSQGLPEAEADVSLVRRAVDELIDNAVKYSPNGGNIRVSVSSPSSQNGRILKVDVRDEGIGIEEEDLATIFEDFHQVDASDTRTYGGLGLGLAFVRRIVEAHRGTIRAESSPGEGSTFSFTLPTADGSDGGGA